MNKEHNSQSVCPEAPGSLNTDQAIGQRIRESRKSLHMTQNDLAVKLGVSVSYISCLERGARPLTNHITMPLLRCLNVSYEYLISGRMPADYSFFSSVCEASAYNERLKLEHLLENCTKAEYEMCYQLCRAYLNTSRNAHAPSQSSKRNNSILH